MEIRTGEKRNNPAQDNISAARKNTQKAYGEIGRALATGSTEDKRLALDIVRLMHTMTPAITKHETLIQYLYEKTGNTTESEKEKTTQEGKMKPSDGRDR